MQPYGTSGSAFGSANGSGPPPQSNGQTNGQSNGQSDEQTRAGPDPTPIDGGIRNVANVIAKPFEWAERQLLGKKK